MELARWLIAITLIGFLSTQFISVRAATLMVLLMIALILVLFSQHLDRLYSWFELRFVTNLTEREKEEQKAQGPALAPWDAHIAKLEVPYESQAAGKTLEELKVREKFGVTIALIGRGNKKVMAPNRYVRLFPTDQVAVIGTDEQIAAFRAFLLEGTAGSDNGGDGSASYSLHPFRLEPGSPYIGRTIRDSGIREKCHGLVVGIERHNQRMLNPDSSVRLEPHDLLWIVADDKLFRKL